MNRDILDIHDLSDFVVYAKDKIVSDVKVSTLAFFDGVYRQYDIIKKYAILAVKPFPLQEGQKEYIQYVYWMDSVINLSKGDIVVVLYADDNFVGNLNINAEVPLMTTMSGKHKTSYGIAMSLKEASSSDINSGLDFADLSNTNSSIFNTI